MEVGTQKLVIIDLLAAQLSNKMRRNKYVRSMIFKYNKIANCSKLGLCAFYTTPFIPFLLHGIYIYLLLSKPISQNNIERIMRKKEKRLNTRGVQPWSDDLVVFYFYNTALGHEMLFCIC